MWSVRSLCLTMILSGLSAIEGQAPRRLPAADIVFEERFSEISGIRELADRSLVVGDTRERRIVRVQASRVKTTGVAREGSGPLEFGFPARILAVGRDSTVVFDSANMRYLVLGAHGEPIGTLPAVIRATGASGGRAYSGIFIARAADARGRLYAEASRVRTAANGVRQPDNVNGGMRAKPRSCPPPC